MNIRIAESDIRFGAKGDAQGNPVARAIKRQTKACDVVAGRCGVMLRKRPDTEPTLYEIPEGAKHWLSTYERGGYAGPMEFTMALSVADETVVEDAVRVPEGFDV